MIDQEIFRAYDIRGTYPEQVNAEVGELIGKGFGTYLRRKLEDRRPKTDENSNDQNSNIKVVVGMDCRTHSPEIHEAFINGLLSTGCDVTNIDKCPSPYMYFVNSNGKFDAGCAITASHNPKEFNGFKLITDNAHAVFGDELQKVYQIIENGEFAEGSGQKISADYYDFYVQKIKSIFSFYRPLKIVIDTGNGIAGIMYPKVLRELGHEIVELFTDCDGTFPNHEADPVKEENTEDLKKKVIEVGADIGLSFDGDGDRLAIITEKGEYITADKLLMLLSKDVLSRNSGGSIVFTVACSQSLFDLIKEWGGKPIMCEVGHSYVEHAMAKSNAILGGEQSGHFFLPENYFPYDDALVTALRTLFILSQSNSTASALFSNFPKVFAIPEIRPFCPDDKKFDILNDVKKYFSDKYPSITIDGIRMDFGKGGWAGIRVSNTSPRISIIMEAQTPEHLEEIKGIVLAHMKTYSEIDWTK
ncbi:phosphomannomutase/phosphoglucomutase [Candidatus Peregrinibacteria bacterium]|nr:phosphomannomutase/phosphoglucomutase [Candidatus Peregrinibacteria bacterium]